jgi:cytochrome bd-type quinol oxidase subunit 1
MMASGSLLSCPRWLAAPTPLLLPLPIVCISTAWCDACADKQPFT